LTLTISKTAKAFYNDGNFGVAAMILQILAVVKIVCCGVSISVF